jgi:type I site-specific restriction endonuclease
MSTSVQLDFEPEINQSCSHQKRILTGGSFHLLDCENEHEFAALLSSLRHEHKPSTPTENILVDKMAQHFWLAQRAQYLQDLAMSDPGRSSAASQKEFALYLRYQTINERAFHTCLSQLLRLRAERRKTEKEAVSQQRKRMEEDLRAAEETRKQEQHEARVRLANAKAAELELDTEIKATIQAPLPAHAQIPFDAVKAAIASTIREVATDPALQNAFQAS